MWWYWCPVCTRCYRLSQRRQNDRGLPLCAYPDCMGVAGMALPWERAQRLHPEYPETPERDVRYPVPELEAEAP